MTTNTTGILAGVCVLAMILIIFIIQSEPNNGRRLTTMVHSHAEAKGDPLDSKKDCNGNSYISLKEKFLREGYVVFRSCSLTNSTIDGAAKYSEGHLHDNTKTDKRRQDGWKEDDDVMNVAADPDSLEILGYLNGRAAFPFQTLNFPVATQQQVHSDVVHFDTLPQRGLMTAAWVALEDIHPDAGPLIYYPGSHRMGLWDLDELRVRVKTLNTDVTDATSNQYLDLLQHAIQDNDLKPAYGVMKKGESFAWAASLLHGGSKLNNPKLTRKSQVTHYYLNGARKYWVPRKSVPSIDKIMYKCSIPGCTPNKFGKDCAAVYVDMWRARKWVDFSAEPNTYCVP